MLDRAAVRRIIVWILIYAFCAGAIWAGIATRRWVFETTERIRFVFDMKRNVFWGLVASGPEGMLNQYEKMAPEEPEWQNAQWVPWFDYGPLRMVVMKEWGIWIRNHYPPAPDVPWTVAWEGEYAYNAPIIHFNTAMELSAAVFAFFLTRLWVRRTSDVQPPAHFRGVWQGIVAALLVWFSPAVLVSGYIWATYDSWVLPLFLLAALLASLDWWFCAGIALAVGAMFKGQQLAVVPVFLLWPLIEGRLGAAARWSAGFILGAAVITSPWLLTFLPPARLEAARQVQATTDVANYPPDLFAIPRTFDVPAAIWVFEMLIVAGAVPWMLERTLELPAPAGSGWRGWANSRTALIGAAAVLIFATVYWPWLLPANRSMWFAGLIAGAALAAAALRLRSGSRPYLLAAVAGGGLLACMAMFHGSHAWWDCAFHYGTIHWPYLIWGTTSNLPGLFQLRFDWPREAQAVAFTIPAFQLPWPLHGSTADTDVTSKQLFNTIYIVLLLVSAVAVGLQARRRGRRMLVALVTPWLIFFCFPVQVQDRYLMYGAVSAAICVGESVGLALLGLFLSFVTAMMTMQVILENSDRNGWGQDLADKYPWLFSPDFGETLHSFVAGTHPDIAWGVLMVMATFLYISLTRGANNGARRSRLRQAAESDTNHQSSSEWLSTKSA